MGIPDVPADTVTLEGDTETVNPLDDELELDPPQPDTARIKTTSANAKRNPRNLRKRQPTSPAIRNPMETKAAPPQWPGFTPPLTLNSTCISSSSSNTCHQRFTALPISCPDGKGVGLPRSIVACGKLRGRKSGFPLPYQKACSYLVHSGVNAELNSLHNSSNIMTDCSPSDCLCPPRRNRSTCSNASE